MSLRRLLWLAALAAWPSLGSAQEIGEGELWLHERVMAYYRKFEGDSSAAYFAVSTNGFDAGYSRCPSFSNCRPLDGKREAIRACNSTPSDLPGTCFIFANQNKILWRGTVHVLTEEEFLAHLYGPDTVGEAMADFVGHQRGPAEGTTIDYRPSATLAKRQDFAIAPAGFALTGDECRYAFKNDYLPNGAPNFFVADPTGRYCGLSTGFAQADESAAILGALSLCAERAPDGAGCLVYAVGDRVIAGESHL